MSGPINGKSLLPKMDEGGALKRSLFSSFRFIGLDSCIALQSSGKDIKIMYRSAASAVLLLLSSLDIC